MKMARHGAQAHHGTKTKSISKLSMQWRDSDKSIKIRTEKWVSDFNSSSDYIYYYDFDVKEICQIISCLSKASKNMDDEIRSKY